MTYSCIKTEIMKKPKFLMPRKTQKRKRTLAVIQYYLISQICGSVDFYFLMIVSFLKINFILLLRTCKPPHSQTVLLLLNSVQ